MQQIVKFSHEDYGECSTTVENFIECLMFDAWSETDESVIVLKEDCQNAYVETL